MLLQNPPTSLNGVVLAVIRRIVQELNSGADVIAKCHQSIEELSAYPTILRTVIQLDLDELQGLLFGGGQGVPPILEIIDHKIARFVRMAKDDV